MPNRIARTFFRLDRDSALTRILFVTASIVLALIFSEALLRIFTRFPISATSNRQLHTELAYTLSPGLYDVDGAGFRNDDSAALAASVDIIAIGDSHTYGTNVRSDQSWPQVLGRMRSRSVYNFGIGGYGIYQYDRLFDLALAKNPKWIILALYPVNDLGFNCQIPDLKYWKGRFGKDLIAPLPQYCQRERTFASAGKKSRSTGILSRIFQNSAVGSLLSITYSGPEEDTGKHHMVKIGHFTTNISENRLREHRYYCNLQEPGRIIHFKNSLEILKSMHSRAKRFSVGFGVLIIPSQELVVRRALKKRDLAIPGFLKDLDRERQLIKRYEDFMSKLGIQHVSATDYLVDLVLEASESGVNVYPNGHPGEAGYRTYAAAAEVLIDRLD
jgi:hypothetical protein